jgi:hypothetical protein
MEDGGGGGGFPSESVRERERGLGYSQRESGLGYSAREV